MAEFAVAVLLLFASLATTVSALTQPPLSTGDPGPFDQNGNLTCGAGPSGSVGGYSPADEDPAALTLGGIATGVWLNQSKAEDITICNEDNLNMQSIYVPQACSQVVAGTNYAIIVEVFLSCRIPDNSSYGVMETVTLDTIVYQPLPGQGDPQVTYLEVSDVQEDIYDYA